MFRWTLALVALLVLAVGVGAIVLDRISNAPLELAQEQITFVLKPGSTARSAAQQLRAAGIPVSEWGFALLARIKGRAAQLKAGTYAVPQHISALKLLQKLARGDSLQVEVRFIEGWSFRQIRKALDEHADLLHQTAGLSDADILKSLNVEETHPEGLFFPDTYAVAKSATDLSVLRTAQALMRKQLTTAWANRDQSGPLKSPYQALILASIIEKETGRPDERGQVGAVFVNRLKLGMRLQTDPTVIYGLGERFDGNLRKRDLQEDGPYNTYTRGGLPPTPIAMPSKAALEAATRPPSTDALYFVARGDGSSHFSRSLGEHNSAVAKYQLRSNR